MINVFIAYRKESIYWRNLLKVALEDLAVTNRGEDFPLRVWSDDYLCPGDQWETIVGANIDACDLFLLLVTTDSDGGYAMTTELKKAAQRARDGNCRIVPVVVNNVMGLLRTVGLVENDYDCIPKNAKGRPAGVTDDPFTGAAAEQKWLGAVIGAIKKLVLDILTNAQMETPQIKDARAEIRRLVETVDAVLAQPTMVDFRHASATRGALNAATHALNADPTGTLHNYQIPHRLLNDLRRAARSDGVEEIVAPIKDLIAALDDWAHAARLAGYVSRADAGGEQSVRVGRDTPGNREDAAKLSQALDKLTPLEQSLEADAAAAPEGRREMIAEGLERLRAEAALARAIAEGDQLDTGELEAAFADQLPAAMDAIAGIPSGDLSRRTHSLLQKAVAAVRVAGRYVRRIVARTFGSPVPDEPASPVEIETPPDDASASTKDDASNDSRRIPGTIWRDEVPGIPETAWPEMVTLPPGHFLMGSRDEERWEGHDGEEEPQHPVQIRYTFAMGRFPVTLGSFAAFIRDNPKHDMGNSAFAWSGKEWKEARNRNWKKPGFPQTDWHPVTCVNWNDAQAYLKWLNEALGLSDRHDAYRLPSEAEWEYGCRAGTPTPFHFGETISTGQANYDGNFTYGSGKKGTYRKGTTPKGQFKEHPNSFGLYDMHGNVWEWCEDVWNKNYAEAGRPDDGKPWLTGDQSLRVLRGGSWLNSPQNLRSADRYWFDPTFRDYFIGFRIARTLSAP